MSVGLSGTLEFTNHLVPATSGEVLVQAQIDVLRDKADGAVRHEGMDAPLVIARGSLRRGSFTRIRKCFVSGPGSGTVGRQPCGR